MVKRKLGGKPSRTAHWKQLGKKYGGHVEMVMACTDRQATHPDNEQIHSDEMKCGVAAFRAARHGAQTHGPLLCFGRGMDVVMWDLRER